MNIFIELPDQMPFGMEINLNESVIALKKKIQKESEIPADSQVLSYKENILTDHQLLSDCKLAKGGTIKVTMETYVLVVQLPENRGGIDEIRLSPSKTLFDLKRLIEQRHNFPIEIQEILYSGNILDDESKTLRDYEISSETTLHLIEKEEIASYTIKLPSGKPLYETAPASSTIAAMKQYLYSVHGYDIDEQVLVSGQEVLEDNRTLSSYKIRDNAVVHLVIEARDGIRVTIKRPTDLSDDSFMLLLRQSSTIKEVKHSIRSSENLPIEVQTLRYRGEDGKEIIFDDPNATLGSYGFKSEIELELLLDKVAFTVKLPDGKSLKFEESPYLEIGKLKDMIHGLSEIHPVRQTLLFRQMVLVDNTSLQSYSIQTGATIHLAYSIIAIMLVLPGSKPEAYPINLYETTAMLKRRIYDKFDKYKEDQLMLIEGGIVLQNDNLLRDYNLTSESTIYVTSQYAEKIVFEIKSETTLEEFQDELRYELPPYTLVRNIKDRLAERLNISKETLGLLAKVMLDSPERIALEDERRLIEYGITSLSEIELKTTAVQVRVKFIAYRDVADITLGPNDSIKKLKEKIKDDKGVPMDAQTLKFGGVILEDPHLPEFYNLKPDSTIELFIKFKVYVKSPAGDLLILPAEATDTVRDLKERIHQRRKHFALENQTLLYITRTLEDDEKLNNYNIDDEATLFLIVRHELKVSVTGEETVVKVTTFESIKKIKTMVKEQLKAEKDLEVELDGKKAVLDEKTLDEDKSLDFYGWKGEKVLILE